MTENMIENETATPKHYPDIKQTVVLLFSFWLIALILTIISVFIFPKFKKNDILGAIAIEIITSLVVLLWGSKKTKKPFRKIFPFYSFNVNIILPIILIIVGFGVILSEIDNITRWLLPMPKFLGEIFLDLLRGKQAFFPIVIVAPFMEELLFRGLILGGFLTHYTVKKAIIASAVIFALFHLIPYQFFSGFFVGIFLGWLFFKTNSLIPCIFAHALFNLGSWLCLNLIKIDIPGFSHSNSNYDLSIVQFQPLWFDLCGLTIFLIGIYLLNAILKKKGGLTKWRKADV